MTNTSVLNVLLYDQIIGTLMQIPGDRTLFTFTDDYVANPNRPPLSLSFKDTFGTLITDHRVFQTRLMPFFSNLLPEGPLRNYLAAMAGVKPIREFFLLQALGNDLPGAVTIRASGDENTELSPDYSPVSRDSKGGSALPTDLRFSLAGMQLKLSAAKATTGGLTVPAMGIGGSWIVKLPSAQFDRVPENEFSMMSMARLVGIDVPDIDLLNIKDIENLPPEMDQIGGQVFAIRRFDRTPQGHRIHIEDFAQIFGVYPEAKYERASYRNIVSVIANESGLEAIVDFIRRLTFNVLIGNADMHLKNWSIIYPDRFQARLAPAYDYVSTIAYIPDNKAALTFSRTKRFDGFTTDELIHLANKAELPEKLVLNTARETTEKFYHVWQSERQNLPLTKTVVTAIEKHLKTLPAI